MAITGAIAAGGSSLHGIKSHRVHSVGVGEKEVCSYDIGIEMFAPPLGSKNCDV